MKKNPQRHQVAHRKPTIDALRALVVLSDTGSITDTAEKLGVSQPVISRKVQVFLDAKACSAVLLRRHGARYALTDAGEAILPALRELVRSYDRVFDYLAGSAIAPESLRIGTGGFAAEYYLPRALAHVQELAEECQVETQVCRGNERILGTARGNLDFSIISHSFEQVEELLRRSHLSAESVEMTKLGSHPLCLAARKGTRFADDLERVPVGRTVPVSMLGGWELIGPDARSGIRRQLESRGRQRSLYFVAEGGGWAASKEFARAGMGIAILPIGTLAERDREDFLVRRLAAEFAIDYLLLSRSAAAGPHHARVKQAIVASFREREKELKALVRKVK